jgi:hypothetical protein
MAEQHEKDGKKFWKFPELPYNVGEQTRAIYNYYMRTDPETGAFVQNQWATYPNHSTPRSLGPLLAMLRGITEANAAKVAQMPGFDDEARIIAEHNRWVERLDFYEAKRQELAQIDPDQPVGVSTNAVSRELGTYIVEPLFLGWYPTTTPPFSEQPGVFSKTPQEQQSVMDLYVPFSLANQIAINRQVLDEAYEQFKQDLKDNAQKLFEEHLPNIAGALGVLPWVFVGAIGLGLYYRARG